MTTAVARHSSEAATAEEAVLSVLSVEHTGGRTQFTMSVPEEIFPMIRNLLESGLSLVRWVETQNRVKKAQARAQDPVEREKRLQESLAYCNRILKKYDHLIKSGMAKREAIRETKKYHIGEGQPITCQEIEIMISHRRKLGREK
ncbi:hypothetical protein GMLC_34640 [Geomonas limicola]|uniref:Uncharacterized protein n=1 Tax=Geomonas limicola TaxID=2740186 RepID=A0A6V8NB90_9BACT|nr:hypothetical protein [Geomonas limicola]GFO69885.1 hypothetical protein GMLC_34640 [Geomonas limicola]